MKLPDRVIIGGEPWDVAELQDDEGMCVANPTLFVRSKRRPELEVTDTFLHELLHAVDSEMEEADVAALATAMAPAVLALLRANR